MAHSHQSDPGTSGQRVRVFWSMAEVGPGYRTAGGCCVLGCSLRRMGSSVRQSVACHGGIPILTLTRWAFNITLFITGVFALAAGGSPGYIALCSLTAIWSIGAGGNLPVDSSVFLGTCLRSISALRPLTLPRVCSCITPVPSDRAVRLVGVRAIDRKPGECHTSVPLCSYLRAICN